MRRYRLNRHDAMSRIFDAATAVILHDGELLVTRRQPQLAAFPGFHVFPGGKVDRTDAETPPGPAIFDAHPPKLMHALIREVREELGYDLAEAAQRGEIAHIVDLGIALTPPVMPVRFNTHFFRIELTRRPDLVPDAGEVASADWLTPAAWRDRYDSGDLLCAPPTIAVLRALAADSAAHVVPNLHFEQRDASELPMIEAVAGVRQVWVRSDTIPPAEHTNCFLLGDAQTHRILVDPSPNSEEEFERLHSLAARHVVHEVFLTHHHPDHRQHSDRMARQLQVPIGMSQDTFERIRNRSGEKFFDGLAVNIYREGDVVCRWLGHAVRVYEVPGHDEGQLALMPDNRAWCIVSDLIQGIGTVVIAKPEGNMRKYFASLARMIELDPQVIYPSHGSALGTTFRLAETLRHRELREQQVLALHREGKNVEAMLPAIYQALDPRLLPLARMNIESHLDKLREDGLA
jgi:ribonuclease/clavin/mitogillin